MNRETNWQVIKDKPAGQDVLSGRDFLDRFVVLGLQGRGDHGVGIMFSKSQFSRQILTQGYGTPQYNCLVALTRLGYSPCFLTEEEISANQFKGVKALIIPAQTVPLPATVLTSLDTFVKNGGRLITDAATTVDIPSSQKLDKTLTANFPGRAHNWACPNLAAGENDTILYARWHQEMAPVLAEALGDAGRGLFTSEQGPQAKASLIQIDAGRDAKYIVAVNDSFIKTQADWHQVTEKLLPTKSADPSAVVYDCTAEKSLGKVQPLTCDLTATTVRMYAVLPREAKQVVSARQSLSAGDDLTIQVAFQDPAGQLLQAVIPFHIAIIRPDGKIHQEFYRGTTRDGLFSMTLPIPANAPAGNWSIAVRSQLSGDLATLPITVAPAASTALASALTDTAIIRNGADIQKLLIKGAKLDLPLFDTPQLAQLLPVAEKVRDLLATQGIEVTIRQKPQLGTYWLSYEATPEQAAENAKVEKGEIIGRIKRTTVNGNDWYSGMSGYRFPNPVILLDLAGQPDNEMAESLDKSGLLWPEVSPAFPGQGRAVLQLVQWAFNPRTPALVIQATDIPGLMAGAESLTKLPQDHLTPAITAAKSALFQQYAIAPAPAQPRAAALTSTGLTFTSAPAPFTINFMGANPIAPQDIQPPTPVERKPVATPALVQPPSFIPQLLYRGQYIEASTPGGNWKSDARFWDAVILPLDVTRAGPTEVVASGVFRYSDRLPGTQAQWEGVLAIYNQVVPKERRPMEFEVRLGDKTIGHLVPSKTESRDMPTKLRATFGDPSAKLDTVSEEVVLELTGQLDLPPARQDLLLIQRNIVDGKLQKLRIGLSPDQAAAIEQAQADEKARQDAEKKAAQKKSK